MSTLMTQAKRLPLHEEHARLGAKFMQFGGWEVPLQYSTIVEEHQAVRRKAGVFDVSHMGKFTVRGAKSFEFLESVLSNSLRKIGPGRALYSLLLNERGGVVDDVIVYQIDRNHFFIIVNAATLEKDYRWLDARRPKEVELIDESSAKTILAVQGPRSEDIVSRALNFDARALKPFHFTVLKSGEGDLFVGATGYTGERGFELVGLKERTPDVFRKIFEAGRSEGLVPAGFGARDTLRLEAKLLLYGQDMDEETTPVEATLEWACDYSKDFIGKTALLRQKENGAKRRLSGFEVLGTGVARHGHEIAAGERKIGIVTSGTFSPSLQKSIGLAYVPPEFSAEGTQFDLLIRDKRVKAGVVKTPFYKKH